MTKSNPFEKGKDLSCSQKSETFACCNTTSHLLIGTFIFVGISWMMVFLKLAYFNPIFNYPSPEFSGEIEC